MPPYKPLTGCQGTVDVCVQASEAAQSARPGAQARGAASGRAGTSGADAPAAPASTDSDTLLRQQVFLRGPICAGKSTALAVLVAWARASDWVVRGLTPLCPLVQVLCRQSCAYGTQNGYKRENNSMSLLTSSGGFMCSTGYQLAGPASD